MPHVIKSVNFGSDATSLVNVGYQLVNSDGTTKQPRTTSNVYEIKEKSGIYSCSIFFDSGWSGSILWDTGELDPVYASEEYYPTNEYIDDIADDTTSILNYAIDIDSKIDDIQDKVTSTSNDLKKVLGLVHENFLIDLPIYDDNNNLIGARIRIYSDPKSVGTTSNIIGTYSISVESNGPGKFTTWKQISV